MNALWFGIGVIAGSMLTTCTWIYVLLYARGAASEGQ